MGFLRDNELLKASASKGALSDLNDKALLNFYDASNVFELLINPILFSSAKSEEKLLLIFKVLKLVEASKENVSFNNVLLMVWYMLRTALFYANFEDIHRRIEQILGRKTSIIVNATIETKHDKSSVDGTEWDVTYMLNTWLT